MDVSLVDALIESHAALLMKKGIPEKRAREEAERAVRDLLQLFGGRKWHLPRSIRRDAEGLRDDAIRAARHRGIHWKLICRTFKIGKTRYYEIINSTKSELGNVG